MKLAVGADHAGFALKRFLVAELQTGGHDVIDLGAFDDAPSDYPDFAAAVAQAVLEKQAERGIVCCGSGVGASVTANKFKGIRACLCHDTYSAHQGVEHDDLNVLCLGGRIVGPALALEIARAFVAAKFDGGERHLRRVEKLANIEETNFKR